MREMADGEVIVTIRSARATRTIAMNRLYWRWYVQPLSEYTGYGPDAIHQYCKRRFLASTRLVIADANGEIVDETDIDATTTTLTKVEFGEYLNHIAEFAESLNVTVGVPVDERESSYAR